MNETINVLFERFKYKKRIAYVLWFIGFPLALHRVYLKDYTIAAIIILGNIATFGLVGLIDVININRRIATRNYDVLLHITKEVKNNGL
jgi:ABC-type arginine/histidine transport system permease subunit